MVREASRPNLAKLAPVLIAASPQPQAAPETPAIIILPAPQPPPSRIPAVNTVSSDGTVKHIAQPGETVTSLAADLLGKDTKTNRDAIINANTSLQADPDKLEAGTSYHIPVAPGVAVEPVVPIGGNTAVASAAVVKLEPKVAETASSPARNEL